MSGQNETGSLFSEAEVFQVLLSQAVIRGYSLETAEARIIHWPGSGEIIFKPDEVHVWTVSLDLSGGHFSSLASLLSPDETNRAKLLRSDLIRARFVTGRAFLRMILGLYIDTLPQDVLFKYGLKGKPYLNHYGLSAPTFNFTHSNGKALLAITRNRNIGIDLEYIHAIPEIDTIATQYFSPGECAVLLAAPETDKTSVFFEIWTAKEAYIKAQGEGFSIPFNSFSVDSPRDCRKILSITGPDEMPSDFSYEIIPIQPPPGYAAALVVEKDKTKQPVIPDI